MKIKLIIISIILLLFTIFAIGCLSFMENIGMISPTDEEQLSPEKGGPPDGLVKVLIGFTERPGKAQQAMVQGVGGKIKYTYHIVDAIAASIPEKAIVALQNNLNVTHVEFDGEIFAIGEILPWGVDRIDAEVVHTSGNKGLEVEVAILDTGIDLNHPDLYVTGGASFVSGKSYDDKNGHGTHVAGIVAALDDEDGVIGVAPEVNLYAVKVLNNRGMGWVSDIIAGLGWSVSKGMQVVNMSLGGAYSETLEEACQTAYDAGLLLVAAAGNDGDVIYPARFSSVIAVSATDSADGLASFSSTGEQVELAAPGVDIYSTYKDGGYATYSGTSMASPHVAGVAALVIAGERLSNVEVRTRLQEMADDLGDAGWDSKYGYGLVDAENAVLGATNGDNLQPLAVGTIAGKVTDADTNLVAIEEATVVVEGISLSATTDANGDYTIINVAEGTYTVTASADGYENASHQEVTVEADATSTANFALNPLTANGVTMYVKSIIFSSKVAGPNKFLYTTVEVLDGNGQSLGGVRVEMTLTHVTSSWDFAGDTGTDGTVKFTLNKAPSGYYTATVTNLEGTNSGSCELRDDGTVIQ